MDIGMSIANLASSMSQAQTMQAWGVGMLSKTMDNTESAGEQLTKMIESVPAAQMELSVNPSVGSMFDVRV